jgi:hypothetical protein
MATKQQPRRQDAKAAPRSAAKPAAKPAAKKAVSKPPTKKPPTKKPQSKAVGRGVATPMPMQDIGMTPSEVKKRKAEEARWRAESDLRTLQEAESIRADSNRLSNAKRHATEQLQALSSVAGAMK